MAALFSRIIPILFAGDLHAERDFYVSLGFHVTYEGPEYPYFLALGHGKVEFGIEWRQDFSPGGPDRVLTWQFGVSDLELCLQLGGRHEDQRPEEASLGLQPVDLRLIQRGQNLLPLRDRPEL